MPLNPKYFIPQEMKTSIIQIFTYEEKNPTGILINSCFSKSMYFKNLVQLLMLMDEMQDSLNYPQESMEYRSFNKESSFRFIPDQVPDQDELQETPVIATFKISVFFKQNASWQGSIAWLERSAEVQFRSTLELIKIMDSALSS